MVYTTPHPDDDAQLAAWRRRQAEDAVRSINIRLPLSLARRLPHRLLVASRGIVSLCRLAAYRPTDDGSDEDSRQGVWANR